MKKKKCWSMVNAGALAMTSVALLAGCRNYLVFSTTTKFGLDISQRADQQPEVTFGYNRAEIVSIPLGSTNHGDYHNVNDAGPTNDAYSVLGTFHVAFDPRLFAFSNSSPVEPGVHVNQLFATGVAAQKAASNDVMGNIFANSLIAIHKASTNSPR